MDNIESLVCAIVDIQGFMKDGKFCPRELAIAKMGTEDILCWDVDTGIDCNCLTYQDKVTNNFISKNLTGLPICAPVNSIPCDKLKTFLVMLYDSVKTSKKWSFGIKNSQMRDILEDAGLPYLEVECPAIRKLDKYSRKNFKCDRHMINPNGMCAGHKVDMIREWKKDEELFKNLINI